jgi:hypothetical protein
MGQDSGDPISGGDRQDGCERVELLSQAGEIVIRKRMSGVAADELFRGRTPEQGRRLYADAYDWESDRGREIVEE